MGRCQCNIAASFMPFAVLTVVVVWFVRRFCHFTWHQKFHYYLEINKQVSSDSVIEVVQLNCTAEHKRHCLSWWYENNRQTVIPCALRITLHQVQSLTLDDFSSSMSLVTNYQNIWLNSKRIIVSSFFFLNSLSLFRFDCLPEVPSLSIFCCWICFVLFVALWVLVAIQTNFVHMYLILGFYVYSSTKMSGKTTKWNYN